MYCLKCGTFNPDGSRFCESCGSPLSASSPAPSGDETVLLSSQKSVDIPSSDDKTVLLTPKGSTATPPVPPRSEASASGPASSSAPTSPAFQPASVQRTQPGAAPNQKPGNPAKPAKSENPPKTTKPHKRKKPLVWVLVILLVLAGLGVGGWFGWNAYQDGQYQEQLSLGEKYLKELNYEDAIIALNRAIEIDPRSPEPYLLLSDAYIEQEDLDSAKKILEQGYEATGGNEEIKKKQEKTEELIVEKEKKEAAEKAAAAVLAPVVEYQGNTYYWQYNADSVVGEGVFASYSYRNDTKNELVCRSEDGTVNTIYTGVGNGEILILNDRLYFSNYSDVLSVKLDGSDLQTFEDASLAAADSQSGYVILSNPNGDANTLESLDAKGNRKELAEGYFLTLQEGVIYYQLPRNQGENVELASIHIDGSSQIVLASEPLDDTMGVGGIEQVQIVDDTVYYCYGFYAGTGHFWQPGGQICSVKQDGSEHKVIREDSGPDFLVYLDDGKPFIRCNSISMNLETGAAAETPLPIGNLKETITDQNHNVWIYPDTSGTPIQLLDAEEGYESEGAIPWGPEQDGVKWKEISESCYTGDYFYFAVTTSTYDSSLDIGWRSGFRRDLTEWYRKDLATGKTELLYSY